jgi:hypothetical protein
MIPRRRPSGWLPNEFSLSTSASTTGSHQRNPLGLRFLRRFRLGRTIECDRLPNERLEGGLVDFFSFVDVDRTAYVSIETRVEETRGILQRRALGEGKLHDFLVGFAGGDDAVVRPNRSAHPLPLLDDGRVCFPDETPHSAEGLPAPVPEFGDPLRDEFRCRLVLARARLLHVLTPISLHRPAPRRIHNFDRRGATADQRIRTGVQPAIGN